jgi:ParB-like chromosome segregation protein Spo0J
VELKVEYVDIETIKPYKRNAKTHPKEQIEQIKKSIQEFGNCDPIGVWHGEIVEGHGRYLALKELGETTIPIIRLDSLTDEQRRAYGLVHNQLTMNSPWDIPALDLELADLDFDMGEFGFDDLSEENTPASNDRSVDFKERLQIIVECSSEDDMEDKFQRITELGIECRISTL